MRGRNKRGRFSRLLRTIAHLRQQDFDLSVDFQNNKWTHFLTWASGIPKRFGYRKGWSGKWLTDGLDSYRNVLPPVRHQFQILERLGIHECDDRLELWVSEEETAAIKNRLERDGFEWDGKPVVGLVVNASVRWKSKNWPLDRFLALAEDLMKNEGAKIVLLGQEGDSPAFNALKRLFPKQFFNLIGKTSLREMFALVKQLDCLVTPDSAPLHVGVALGVKVVTFFGPTDPVRHLPPSGDVTLLKKVVPCAPCYSEKCKQPTHRCMEEISLPELRRIVTDQIQSKVFSSKREGTISV
jgi:heptosyltransferase-1/heptosyltransferase-2